MTQTKSETPAPKPFYTHGMENVANHTLPETSHLRHGIPQRAIAADVNLRAGHNRHNYDAQRPADKLPTKHAEIITACQAIYRKIGTVRNIIDLMTDFAAEGLTLQHTTKSQERFYREWAKRVNLQGRAHDFMKLLMRDANVIVRRQNASISKPVKKEMARGGVVGPVDETKVVEVPEKIKVTKRKTGRAEIPWKYTFLSPVIIEKIGGEVGRFFGADALGMRIPLSLANSIKSPKTDAEKELIKKLPADIRKAANRGSRIFALDMDKIYVDYYKKDDWEDWGTPFLYGVLEDVMFKEKMRLADMAALDGVINCIRVWKLGKSELQILPTPAAVDRLIGILQDNTGGGVLDLVWDDMIDLQVEYPPTDKILGAEKYEGVNTDIRHGLGIPDSLIGGSSTGGGGSSSQKVFVQLKTMAERLEYVRSRAIRWIEGELQLVADAMDFKNIPAISFGTMSLRDEAAEKQLIIQLLDRNIISSEKATEVFGVNYMIELERLKSEHKIRAENPGAVERSNPYNRPFSLLEKTNDLAIELEGVKSKLSQMADSRDDNGGGDNPRGDQPKKDGANSPGRPPSTRDTNPRNERTPKTQSILNVIGYGLMDKIDQLVDNTYLEQHGTKNMRSLTKAQRSELERTKRGILSVLHPTDEVTKELIVGRIDTARKIARLLETCFDSYVADFTTSVKRVPTIRERRMLTSIAWSNIQDT